jgi:vacuolar-type H+-ATPase subunit B/Vma2
MQDYLNTVIINTTQIIFFCRRIKKFYKEFVDNFTEIFERQFEHELFFFRKNEKIKKELLERSAKKEMEEVHRKVTEEIKKARPVGMKQKSKRKQKRKQKGNK